MVSSWRWLAGVALAVGLGAAASAQDTLQIDGSTTVGPIVDAFVEAFEDDYPTVGFTVKKTGSGDGASALIEGRCQIAAMSRFMKNEEYAAAVAGGVKPVPFGIAMDGVCVVVHPANTVESLSQEQVKAIYTGRIANWQQIGGPNLPIVLISRDSSSGTYEVFEALAMDHAKLAAGTEYVNSNPQMFDRISATPGAIGYLGLGFVKAGVKAVKYENVVPTRQTIAGGVYPLSRPLFLFTDGYPQQGSLLFSFCNFFLSEEGHEIIEAKGFVPMTDY